MSAKDFIDTPTWWTEDLNRFVRENPPVEGVDYVCDGTKNEKWAAIVRAAAYETWADPVIREKRIAANNAVKATCEYSRNLGKGVSSYWKSLTPEERSEAMKRRWETRKARSRCRTVS